MIAIQQPPAQQSVYMMQNDIYSATQQPQMQQARMMQAQQMQHEQMRQAQIQQQAQMQQARMMQAQQMQHEQMRQAQIQQQAMMEQAMIEQAQMQQAMMEQALMQQAQIPMQRAISPAHENIPSSSESVVPPALPRAPAPCPSSTRVCRYWAKEGRCPCRGCPYAASHTASNSPRYAKFNPDASVDSQAATTAPRRANALAIVDPSGATTDEASEAATAPSRVARTNALVIKEPPIAKEQAGREHRERTPSPPGSRLSRWMGNGNAQSS